MSRVENSCEICSKPNDLSVLWFCNSSHRAHAQCVNKVDECINNYVAQVFKWEDLTEMLYIKIDVRTRIKEVCEGNILNYFEKGEEKFKRLIATIKFKPDLP